MVFDSSAALILFAACVSVWHQVSRARPAVRLNIRFAVLLFAALACARALGLALPDYAALAPAVALIAASLGTSAIALGLLALLARPLPPLAASIAFILALGAGLAAALAGIAVYAVGCVILSVALIIAAGLSAASGHRTLLSLVTALSLLAGCLCLMDAALGAALLFFAAGLVGAAQASQPGVETEGKRHRVPLISGRG